MRLEFKFHSITLLINDIVSYNLFDKNNTKNNTVLKTCNLVFYCVIIVLNHVLFYLLTEFLLSE